MPHKGKEPRTRYPSASKITKKISHPQFLGMESSCHWTIFESNHKCFKTWWCIQKYHLLHNARHNMSLHGSIYNKTQSRFRRYNFGQRPNRPDLKFTKSHEGYFIINLIYSDPFHKAGVQCDIYGTGPSGEKSINITLTAAIDSILHCMLC